MKTNYSYKFMAKQYSILSALFIAALLVSCTKEDRGFNGDVANQVSFSLSTIDSNGAATKVTPYNSSTKFQADGESFGVVAYKYASSGSENWEIQSDAVEVKYNSGVAAYFPSTPIYYAGSGFMRFFAYAPFKDGDGNAFVVKIKEGETVQKPTLDFTVNPDVSKQIDFLVATPGEVSGNPNMNNLRVPLVFRHALTAIRFKAESGLEVKEIKITGVYDKGTLDFESTEWSGLSVQGSEFVIKNGDETALSGTDNGTYVEYNENLTMMMIPQKLPSGAKIKVTFADDSFFEKTLANHIWGRGNIVNYTITPTDITTNLYYLGDPSMTDIVVPNENHGTSVITIYSFWTFGDGSEKHWAPLSITYSDSEEGPWYAYDAIPKDMVVYDAISHDVDPVVIAHSNISAQLHIDVQPNDPADDATRKERKMILKSRPELPSTDLSMWDATYGTEAMGVYGRNRTAPITANCYIIRQRGEYRFPCVYGNAIDASKSATAPYENENAFNKNGTNKFPNFSDNYINTPFLHLDSDVMDGLGADLSNPSEAAGKFIENYEAIIVWQDLVESKAFIPLNTNTLDLQVYNLPGTTLPVPYVSFAVNDAIQEGNIVMAVRRKSDQTIVWSWHIWVTAIDDFTPHEVVNSASVTTKLMPSELGYNAELHGDAAPPRVFYVKFTQDDSGKSKIVKVTHQGKSLLGGKVVYSGNAPYYQFGRKDPLLPKRATYSLYTPSVTQRNKYFWSPNGILAETYNQSASNDLPYLAASSAVCIQNPHVFSTSTGANRAKLYLWNSSATTLNVDEKVIKSVYDPCPPGYCVPRKDFGTALAYIADNKDYGYAILKRNVSDSDGMIVHTFGTRNFASSAPSTFTDGTQGSIWGAALITNTQARTVRLMSTVSSTNQNVAGGRTVIPAVEE